MKYQLAKLGIRLTNPVLHWNFKLRRYELNVRLSREHPTWTTPLLPPKPLRLTMHGRTRLR